MAAETAFLTTRGCPHTRPLRVMNTTLTLRRVRWVRLRRRFSVSRQRLAVFVFVGVIVFALAACDSASNPASSSQPPSHSPAATSAATLPFPVPSKSFDSAELGIAFQYPATWRLESGPDAASTFRTTGSGQVAFIGPRGRTPHGFVAVQVSSPRIFQGKPALPYNSVPIGPLPTAPKGKRDLHAHYVRVDGLRLVAFELSDDSGPAGDSGRWQ